jgi:Fe-S-cluster-containing dehydrogenase component
MAERPGFGVRTLGVTRRLVLGVGALVGAVAALFGGRSALAQAEKAAGADAEPLSDMLGRLFQKHYQRMSPDEVKEAVGRIERRAKRQYGEDITVGTEPAMEGVVFGYALNISKCKGVRKCVEACVAENNTGRDSSMQYIRVLELDHGDMNLNRADHYYEAETVPRPGKFYLPVQCMQCDNPPCVKACPVEATWQEPDGITVVDYDWCIGCRYCMAACPYWARHFNWNEPTLSLEALNTDPGAWSRSARSASSARARDASRRAWRPAPPAPVSSATCSIRAATSGTSSRTRRSSGSRRTSVPNPSSGTSRTEGPCVP